MEFVEDYRQLVPFFVTERDLRTPTHTCSLSLSLSLSQEALLLIVPFEVQEEFRGRRQEVWLC